MIVLAGLIGAGKSSLAKILGDHLHSTVFYEAVDNNPIIDLYYQHPKQYAFLLQIYFLNKRFKAIKEASQLKNSILDRSIFEDDLFLTLNYKNGNVSSIECETYKELLANMLEELDEIPKKTPDILIYIDISFDKMLERIKKRGREYEQIENHPELYHYYQQLFHEYQSWIKSYQHSPKLIIDGDHYDFVENTNDKNDVLEIIINSLNKLNQK